MVKKTTAKQQKPVDFVEGQREMRAKGIEQIIPGTQRVVRLRTLDSATLLREGKMPDILTPLVVKSVYQDLTDNEVRKFVEKERGNPAEALEFIDVLDFVASKSIADGTRVEDLTIPEKRWIFRLAMGAAELLIFFRYEPESDVAVVDESEDVQPVT